MWAASRLVKVLAYGVILGVCLRDIIYVTAVLAITNTYSL
ncbi:hypothetical protein DSUL_130013 [Desulfovibrionales bacterium]